MGTPIRVLLADDQDHLLRALRRLIEAEPGMEVVGEASDGGIAVDLAAELQPDVLVIDYCMPRMNGLEAVHRIRQKGHGPLTILLTAFDEVPGPLTDVVHALVHKHCCFRELPDTIRKVIHDRPPAPADPFDRQIDRPSFGHHRLRESDYSGD